MKNKEKVILILYILLMTYLLFFRRESYRSMGYSMYNLELFSTIKMYITYGAINPYVFVVNIVGNIVMLVPLGLILPNIFDKCKKLLIMICLGIIIPLSIEIIQYVSQKGIFDVDDILLNFIGIIIGYIIYIIWRKK